MTKDQLEADLGAFLLSFAKCADEVFAVQVSPKLAAQIRDCPFWHGAMRLYEYAAEGTARSASPMDDDEAMMNVIFFLEGLSAYGHGINFGSFSLSMPQHALDLAEKAHARHVLDGGRRHPLFVQEITDGHLSIAEIALLANMDEKSVRNASGSKAGDRLITTKVATRAVVQVQEANRWLAGRKEFVPTRRAAGLEPRPAALMLSPDLAEELRSRAMASGMDVESFIRKSLTTEAL